MQPDYPPVEMLTSFTQTHPDRLHYLSWPPN